MLTFNGGTDGQWENDVKFKVLRRWNWKTKWPSPNNSLGTRFISIPKAIEKCVERRAVGSALQKKKMIFLDQLVSPGLILFSLATF